MSQMAVLPIDISQVADSKEVNSSVIGGSNSGDNANVDKQKEDFSALVKEYTNKNKSGNDDKNSGNTATPAADDNKTQSNNQGVTETVDGEVETSEQTTNANETAIEQKKAMDADNHESDGKSLAYDNKVIEVIDENLPNKVLALDNHPKDLTQKEKPEMTLGNQPTLEPKKVSETNTKELDSSNTKASDKKAENLLALLSAADKLLAEKSGSNAKSNDTSTGQNATVAQVNSKQMTKQGENSQVGSKELAVSTEFDLESVALKGEKVANIDAQAELANKNGKESGEQAKVEQSILKQSIENQRLSSEKLATEQQSNTVKAQQQSSERASEQLTALHEKQLANEQYSESESIGKPQGEQQSSLTKSNTSEDKANTETKMVSNSTSETAASANVVSINSSNSNAEAAEAMVTQNKTVVNPSVTTQAERTGSRSDYFQSSTTQNNAANVVSSAVNDSSQESFEQSSQSDAQAEETYLEQEQLRQSPKESIAFSEKSSFSERLSSSVAALNSTMPTANSAAINEQVKDSQFYEQFMQSLSSEQTSQIKTVTPMQAETIAIYRKDFANAMKEKVDVMINQKLQQVDIQLDPPEMGNVQVRVNLQGEQATVNFIVQNQQAKDALEQNMDKLRNLLADSGVDVGDANVEQQQKNDQNGEQQAGDERLTGDDNHQHNQEQQTLKLVKASSTGVDYYA